MSEPGDPTPSDEPARAAISTPPGTSRVSRRRFLGWTLAGGAVAATAAVDGGELASGSHTPHAAAAREVVPRSTTTTTTSPPVEATAG